MIKSFTVINPNNESLTLKLSELDETGLYIMGIDGLGPSKASINTTEVFTIDGSLYSSARTTERNIVLTLGMRLDPSIEDARLKTYRYFPIKKKVQLILETDIRSYATEGYIESNEPVIFSSQEYTTISIICPDPYFKSLEDKTSLFVNIIGSWEFEWEIPEEVGCELSYVAPTVVFNVDNHSATDSGMMIEFKALSPLSNPKLINTETTEWIGLDIDMRTGDVITINTYQNNKRITRIRDGVTENIFNALMLGSTFLQLLPGDNLFKRESSEGYEPLEVIIRYKTKYEGV